MIYDPAETEYEDWEDYDEQYIETADGGHVVLYGPTEEVVLGGVHLYYREGDWLEEYDGELVPDWSLTWFYEDTEHPEKYFYYEQDPAETALYNLTRIMEGRQNAVKEEAENGD